MDKFVRQLLTEWRRLELASANETYLVAVSGGADSVALLLALDDLRKRKKLNVRFVAAHFNHDLRGAESDGDAVFVGDLCARLEFEKIDEKGSVERKGNLEQNARLARYRFLFGAAERLAARGVLTAHTVNDQAETFLLNLLRGSGLGGLGAMRPVTADYRLDLSRQTETESTISPAAGRESRPAIMLARPLLEWAMRAETEHYCRRRGVDYREDQMNYDPKFRRVRVRRELLPALAEFNPRIVETLARTARVLRQEGELLEELGRCRPAILAEGFSVKELRALSRPAQLRALRGWLELFGGDLRKIELKHVEAVADMALSHKSGRVAELPGGASVLKKAGRLYLRSEKD